MMDPILSMIGICRKAGKIEPGEEPVDAAVRARDARLLLLAADAVSRSIGSGSALPVGAITSLLGAPFFLTLIFGKKEGGVC